MDNQPSGWVTTPDFIETLDYIEDFNEKPEFYLNTLSIFKLYLVSALEVRKFLTVFLLQMTVFFPALTYQHWPKRS